MPRIRSLIPILALVCACSQSQPTIERDLLEGQSRATVTEESAVLDIGTETTRGLLGKGWSIDEFLPAEAAFHGDTNFVWSTGDGSEVFFYSIEPRPLELTLGVRPFWYPNAPPLGVEVFINGHAARPFTLSEGDQTVKLDVPAEWLHSHENRLRLVPSRNPVAAQVLPASRDPRRLGVGLFFIALGDGSNQNPDGSIPRLPVDPAFAAHAERASRGRSATRSPEQQESREELVVRAPAEIAWPIRAAAGTSLEYELELAAGSTAEMRLDWLSTVGEAMAPTTTEHRAGVEIEGLAQFTLSDSWLGTKTVSGTVSLPAGLGTLRLRALSGSTSGEHPPTVRVRRMRLRIPPPAHPLNLVWVTLDTFRADHIGAWGHPDIHTPVLDRLARDGAQLTDVVSQIPITGPAHASMFTGRYPVTHGVRNNGQPLALGEETLAEYLNAYGWRTAAVVSLIVLRSKLQFSQGFDQFADCPRSPWWRRAPEVTDAALELLRNQNGQRPFFLWAHYSDTHEPYAAPGTTGVRLSVELDGKPVTEWDVSSAEFARGTLHLAPGRNVLRFATRPALGETSASVVVRYLHFESPMVSFRYGDGFTESGEKGYAELNGDGHVEIDYAGKAPGDVPFAVWAIEHTSAEVSRARYTQEAELVDRELGRLLDGLAGSGLAESTLVLISSDHGEGLWDHGQPGHIEQLYDEAAHSPVILRLPARLKAQLRGVPAEHVDLLPTVLDLLELPRKPDVQGASLVSALSLGDGESLPSPPSSAPRQGRFLQTFTPQSTIDRRALIQDGWKLIVTKQTGQRELYNVAADPAERVDRSAELPELVERMSAQLAQLEAKTTRAVAAPAELSPAELEQLKALGYAQ